MRFGGGARVALSGLTTLLGLLFAAPALGEPFITLSPPVEVDESREWVPRAASVADVATDGTNSLAVYTGYNDSPVDTGFIMGRRLGSGGAPDGTPFEIYSGSPILYLRIVFDGTGYLVLWIEGVANDYSLRFMRLKSDGDIVTDAATLEQRVDWLVPAMAAGETGTLVVRGSSDGCRTWLITSDTAGEGDPISLDKYVSPTVGFSDGTWLVAYTEPDANDQSYFVQFGGDGHILPGTSSSLAAASSANWQRIAPAADGFVVSREDVAKIDFVHVDFDGTAALEPYELTPTNQELGPYPHSFFATSSGYAVVYDAHAAACDDCFWNGWLQPLKPTLEPATAKPLALVAHANTFASATLSGGSDALLAWKDGQEVLRAAPLALGDNPKLDVDAAVSVGLPDQGVPKVAPGSFGWLAVWPEERITDGRVSGVLLDDAGNPEGNPVVLLPEAETLSDLVRGPSGWLMASQLPSGLHLISEDLQATNVTVAAPTTSYLRIAGSSAGWIVAWLEQISGLPSLRAARLNEVGTVIDSTTVASVSDLTAHHVLARGGSYEVLWTDGVGVLWSVQIPTSGCLSVSAPQKLANVGHAAHIDVARSADTWWGWMNVIGKFVFRTADGQIFPDDGFALPMTEVDGLVLTGTKARYPDSYLSIGLAAPNSPLKVLATASGTTLGLNAADLSDSFEHRALLATLDPDWIAGDITNRITTRVITVFGGTPQGGTGGTGGSGCVTTGGEGGDSQSAAGQSTGGSAAGAPDAPSAAGGADQSTGTGGAMTEPSGNAGRTSTPLGGESSSTGNEGDAGDSTLPPGAPRTSSGCGCKVAGSDNDNGRSASLAASLLLGLTLLRRRRGLGRPAGRP